MRKWLASVSVAVLALAQPTHAQVSGTAIVVGSTPIVGTCGSNFNLFNNNGVVGCQANGSGGGGVSSVSNSGAGTLTISPTTGAVLASINLGNPNTWTACKPSPPTNWPWQASRARPSASMPIPQASSPVRAAIAALAAAG